MYHHVLTGGCVSYHGKPSKPKPIVPQLLLVTQGLVDNNLFVVVVFSAQKSVQKAQIQKADLVLKCKQQCSQFIRPS